jgi:hypothetical protein
MIAQIIRQITLIISKIRNDKNNNGNMKFKEDIIEEEVDVKYESTFDNYNINKDNENQGNNQKKYPRYGRRRN